MLKNMIASVFALALCAMPHVSYASKIPTCESEIKAVNSFLQKSGMPTVRDINALAGVLRQLTRTGRLPDRYITTDEAKRLGWSGRTSETLWGVTLTNGKLVGGDKYHNPKLPARYNWHSADLDVVKGYRSNTRLIYSPASQQRFLTTDRYQHFVEIDPCK